MTIGDALSPNEVVRNMCVVLKKIIANLFFWRSFQNVSDHGVLTYPSDICFHHFGDSTQSLNGGRPQNMRPD